MSLKALRSRLRSSGDADQGSPSRSSVYTQLATLLSDEPRSQDSVDSVLVEDELVALVADPQGSEKSEVTQDAAIMATEQINSAAANLSELRYRLLSSCESFDQGSDRDSEGPNEEAILRNSSISSPNRASRKRFSQRKKCRYERSKSLDRAGGLSLLKQAESTDSLPNLSPDSSDVTTSPESKESRLPHRRIAAWARELIDDLQEIEVKDDKEEEPEGKPLSIKRLKNNIVRFGRATKPVSTFSDSLRQLIQWESPTATILFIMIMLYALWHGLLLPLVIFASICKLSANYLVSRGWFDYSGLSTKNRVTRSEDGTSSSEKSSSVTERLALILQVARKVQNQLGSICDAAEKIKNLLMWRHEATRKIYLTLWIALPVTLLIPASQLITFVAFYLLIKVFVVDFAFLRFPRLRAKYDTSSRIWQTLPTDADLESLQRAEGLSNTAVGQSPESRSFSELFNLPPTESPLPGWQSGCRSTLVNRDKSLTSAFRTGRLFLSPNYLCFERSKTHPQKNVVIPLDRITRLEKGNQYSWIPGGGMIIEVFVQGIDKAYTFGAIMNRDETFTAIRIAAEKRGCVWEEDKPKADPNPTPQ